MGRTLKMVGMCEAAVDVYVKSGRIKQAIDTCVYLNHWSLAIELAKKHKIKVILIKVFINICYIFIYLSIYLSI